MLLQMNRAALLLVCGMESIGITFCKIVSPDLYNKWLALCNLLISSTLSEEDDTLVWMFHPSSEYSVKSYYELVNNGGIISMHTRTPLIFGNSLFP
jgi:hypothetical protein